MRKDIPEYISISLNNIHNYCLDRECKDCPFMFKECYFEMLNPSRWHTGRSFYVDDSNLICEVNEDE